MDNNDVDRIGALYDAALHPGRLPEILVSIAQVLDASACRIACEDGQRPSTLRDIPFDVRNEGKAPTSGDRLTAVDTDDDGPGTPPDAPASHRLSTQSTAEDSHDVVHVIFQRPGHLSPFSDQQRQRFKVFEPHLQRVLQLMTHASGLQRALECASQGLEAGSIAVLTMTKDGRFHYGNRLARALLRTGNVIKLDQGRVVVTDNNQRLAFASKVQSVASNKCPANLLIHAKGDKDMRFSLTLAPMPVPQATPTLAHSVNDAEIQCLLTPIDQRRIATVKQLTELFGLTTAEARLARGLASGLSLDEYASKHDIRITTAKKHLSEIFIKTGCNRQASVVRLVTSVPVVR